MAVIKLKNGKGENGETLYKEYPVLFDVNTMEQVQSRYGEIAKLSDEISRLSEIRWVLTLLINEAIEFNNYEHQTNDKLITEKWLGMVLPLASARNGDAQQSVANALSECLGTEKNEITE